MTLFIGKGIAVALAVLSASMHPKQDPAITPGTGQGDSSALGKAGPENPNAFNPQIAIVSDFRALLSSRDGTEDKKVDLKELEMGIAADVDPFLRAEAYIAFAKENGESVVEVEEAFGRYSNLGRGVSGKFGKIAAAIGRVQRNHADQLNYLDYPFMVQDFLGDEGLRAGGGSISYLLPGDKFHEFTIEGVDSEDAPLFAGAHSGAPVWVGHYRTFFDFNEDTSAQLGATYANGPGGAGSDGRSDLFGVDLVYKWVPGTKGKSLVIESEALWGKSGQPGARRAFGAFVAANYQLRPNLYGYARYDTSEAPDSTNRRDGWTAGLTLKPTEFHHWRVEFQQIRSNFAPDRNLLNLQFQMVFGAHPAHKY